MDNKMTDSINTKEGNKQVKDSFQAFLVKDAKFTPTEEYPIIENWMISKDKPEDIITFRESLKIHDPEKCKDFYVCTYEPDDEFERIRRNPKRYVKYFQKFAGLIGFDYSVHSDQPIIKQKSQMNDNLSLLYYFGNNGVNIIPNVRPGIDELAEEYFKAFPKNTLVAIGTHGFVKTKAEKYEWYALLKMIIENLQPSGIIDYGTLNGKMFDEIKKKVPIFTYDSWAEKKYKEGKKNGIKRTE